MMEMETTLRNVSLTALRLVGLFLLPGWCNLCRRPTLFLVRHENLREDLRCLLCGSFNRQRQVGLVLGLRLQRYSKPASQVRLWNAESSMSLHESLRKAFADRYTSSEYFDRSLPSGVVVDGVRHEDICETSFPAESFDFVITSDVLEHVSDPGRAFGEIYRVLKPGGEHIFTVPFAEGLPESDIRARIGRDGVVQHFTEPIVHGDPLRKDGALVYTIFGEDLAGMCENSGMTFAKVRVKRPALGILGEGLVFVSVKDGSVIRHRTYGG